VRQGGDGEETKLDPVAYTASSRRTCGQVKKSSGGEHRTKDNDRGGKRNTPKKEIGPENKVENQKGSKEGAKKKERDTNG